MVTQNTTTAGAASAARHIQLTQPQANQQVVIDNIAGAALDMSFPSEAAQLEQSGQDLVFLFENGGRIVLSNFFGLFDSHQLPAFNLEDGQSLPGDAFLAALREDLLPAAGPGAGAAAGSGGVGDYADDAGNLIGGVDRLDPLGTGTFGTAALPGIEDAGPLDLATGTLLVSLTTGITTTIGENGGYPEHPDAVPPGTYVGVFEDWEPNQHLGSHLAFQAAFGFTFTPDDNEVLNTITFTGPIGGHLLVNGVEVLPDGAGNYVIAAGDIGNVSLLPNADSGADVPLSGYATITDPDSGLTGTVPFAFTAVVDAVADQPIGLHETVTYGPFHCEPGGGNGEYGGEVRVLSVSEGPEGLHVPFPGHFNPHDAPDGFWHKTAADPTNVEAGDHTQSAVHITLSATFGDYQDGSERHYLIIEAKEGWTYDTVNIGGVELALSEFLTLGANIPASGTQGSGTIDPTGHYYVIPVGDESIVSTSSSVDGQGQSHELATKAVTLTMYAPDEHYESGGNGGYEGNGDYPTPAIAMTEQGGEGQHCGPSGNDYQTHFVTGALAVDSDTDGSLTLVNDNSLVLGSTTVWVAPADGTFHVTGQQIGYEDPQAFAHDPPSWYDPFSTKDIDLTFQFKGADDEVLDQIRIAVGDSGAKVLIYGHEATFVSDGEGGGYYVVPAWLKDHVTLMPTKDSDVDVSLKVTAVFHDPDSGDVAMKTVDHTVFIDAVADKPVDLDSSAHYTPGPSAADPHGTMNVNLSATFGDVLDGSEKHFLGIEMKYGWSYQPGGSVRTIDGVKYMVYEVDPNNAGNAAKNLVLGVPDTDSRYTTTFKTIAIADEVNTSGVEWNPFNNEAYTTDTLKVTVDGADGCLHVSGSGYEDLMPNAHLGNFAEQPIKLNIGFDNADNEVLQSVNVKALGQSFTIVVDGVETHLATGQSIDIVGSKANSVYIIPEDNNANDIRVQASATIKDPDSGDFSVRTDTATITVDAVADKPTGLHETVDYGTGHDAGAPDGHVSVAVTASFGDVHDGSEKHYIGIEYKSGWDYPDGGSLKQLPDGTWYKVYDVTSIDNSGTVIKNLSLGVPGTDSHYDANFKTVAYATDSEAAGDSGLTNANNAAYTYGTVGVHVDNAAGCLQVSGGGYEDWMPDAHEGNMAIVKTALNVNFTPADTPSHGPEVLDNVVVKFAGKAFTLVVGDGPGAHEYTLDGTPGHTQVSVSAADSGHLYIRTTANSDMDIPLKVTANFHDPSSGDPGSATVDHTVVIDAVADKPTVSITHIETDTNPNDLEPSYQFGETGKVHVHATFGDYSDGSETHTVTVTIPDGFVVDPGHGGTVAGSTLTWTVSGGSFDKDISFTYKGEANDGTATFTATATADETNFSGSGLDLTNNHAETSATASVVIADHAPSANNAAAAVAEDELHTVNPLFEGTHVNDVPVTTVHSGTLAYDFGNGGKGGFSWTLPGAQGTETDADDASTPNVLHNLTSGGVALAWELADSGHTLIGKADGAEVIRVELTNIDTHAYKVTLSGPIDHPDNDARLTTGSDRGVEDMLEIGVSYTITDGFGTHASGTVFVTVLDDAPTAGDVLGTATTNGSIPHFMPDGYELNMVGSEHDPSNLITITATAPDGHGNPNPVFTADGGGVSSDGDRLDEIDFFRGSGSEALVIDLGGKLALGATVNLGKFYSEEPTEKGVVEFYRDGELVATRTFSAVSGSGDADVSFSISEGPFDKMVFKALDNGVTGLGDNSDYYVESITFQSAPAVPVGYANGVVPHIFGADGPGKVWLSGMDETDSSVKTMAGEAVRLVMSADGTVVHGYVGTGTEQAFELRMTPTTGEWDFIQYKQLNIADHQLDFRYSVVDGDGDVITQQLDVKVLDFSPPHAGDPLSIGLDDAGAAGGAVDSHTAHLTFTAGSDGLTAGDYSFAAPTGANVPHVEGLTGTIVWSVDGSGHLIGSIGGHPAIELSLSGGGNTGVDVTAKLIDPLHHTDGSTDVTVTGIHVVANDGVTAPATGTVNINIADDHPIAHDDAATYNPATTNVVIVLDVSASMGPNASYGGGDPDGPGGFATKFDLAKAAITDLLSAYHDLGSVNVKIVWFGDTAETHTGWLSGSNVLSDAQGVLNGVTLQTYTHYDDAITLVKGQLATMPTADRSVMYFLSDGEPNPSGEALNSTETAQWETALQGSHMDIVYAIGIGNGVTDTTNLATVGWERGVTGDANTVEIITTPSDLSGHLLATLPTHGNLINNDTAGADGDKHLYSVTLGADTYHVGDADATTHVLKLTLADGKGILTIDFDDGSFQYFPGHYPVGTAAIQYTIADGDGSHSNTATLNLTLNGAYVDAHDNYANAPLPGTSVTTEYFNNDSHGWSTDSQSGGDGDGYVIRNGAGGSDPDLLIALTNSSGDIGTSKTFTVASGDTVSFAWRADAIGSTSNHDSDRFEIVVSDGRATQTVFTVGSNGADGSGVTPITFNTAGTYTVTLRVVDGGGGNNYTGGNLNTLNVYIDDMVFTHALAGAALFGNVIADHAGADVADQMVNTVATVAEVNGVAIGGSGTDIAGDYGTLHINPDGSYEYHANAGVAAGHDDAFVYKLSSAADSDYATLNIHIGSGDTHLQASGETWTGSGTAHDFHLGTTGGDTLNGGDGNDVIFGNYGNDVIHGNAGNDYLHGGAGNDTLYGDAGNDILVGGQGSDILYGDGPGVSVHGADTFMWNAEDFTKNAVDTVKDFAPGEGDVLRFADVLLDHDGNSANGIQLDLVRMSGADSNNAQLTLHHGAETQTVVIENVFNSGMTSSQVDATLQAMEQHILNHKIITENS